MKLLPTLLLTSSAALLAYGASTADTGALGLDRENSISVTTDHGTLWITPITDDIFRLTVVPEKRGEQRFLPSTTSVLKPNAQNVRVNAFPGILSIESPSTKVEVDRATGLVTFRDSKGNELLREATSLDNSGPNKSVAFVASPKDNFFGAGERGHSLRLNGDTLAVYNRQNYGYTAGDPRISQMNITMPYLVSDRGYGILIDDHNKAQLIAGDTIRYTSTDPASMISYYFINGKGSLAGATEEFTRLTGRQELPPFWSLGYINSKYGYHNQAETLGAIDSLKRVGYPVDGIVLDLYWYGQETDMGRLEWDKQRFPDHVGMLDTLRAQGVKTVIIHQPYINKIGAIDNYNMLKEKDMLTKDGEGNVNDVTTWVGKAGMFDVSNPATREWLWQRLRSLTEEGVEGWWGDLGEPEVHPETIVHANGQTAEQYHNVYGNEWSRIIYDGFKKDFPDKRIMTLMRGGTTGLQRYNVFPWSTDVSRSWGGFEPQVIIMLNSGLSGLGYMSSDIGGFAVDPANPTDEELYVRWLQMGTFTPTLRTHAQLKPEPYHYPASEKITLKYIKERYRWLPYNYTLAYENVTKGLPLARPLDFNSTDGAKYADVTDEYLWGNEMLIAPVFKKGARSRKVTFPAGSTWIDWYNPAKSYVGGTSATVAAPLDKLPMFVRRGAFIPLYDKEIQHTDEYNPAYLTVKYFPSAEQTEYTLFDDDRLSTRSLEEGMFQLTTFRGCRKGGETRIDITSTGTYPGMPKERILTFEIENVARPKQVTADGTILSRDDWSYDARTRRLTVRLLYTSSSLTLTAK